MRGVWYAIGVGLLILAASFVVIWAMGEMLHNLTPPPRTDVGWQRMEAEGLVRFLDPETGTVCYRDASRGSISCVRYLPMAIPKEAIIPGLGRAKVVFPPDLDAANVSTIPKGARVSDAR